MPRTALASIDSGSARPDRRCSAKDVARLAGVSTATVSRVLNSPDQVDARTQDLVRDAVTKLRYVPHGTTAPTIWLRCRRSARAAPCGT